MLTKRPVSGGSGQQGTSAGTGKSAESSKCKIGSLPVTSLVAGHEVCGRKIYLRQGYSHRWIYGFLTDFNPETHKHRFVQAANPSPDIDGPMVREPSSSLIGRTPHRRNGSRGGGTKETGSVSHRDEKSQGNSNCKRAAIASSHSNSNACSSKRGSDSQSLKVERVANSDVDDYEEAGGSDAEDGCHGGVSEDADISEGGELVDEWICLGKRLFRWCEPPPPNSQPNPTFKNFPGNEAAIGWKVRVFWNEMGRWYVGHVRSFDKHTGKHEIRFCDGDVRFYIIRNEPVLWLDKPVCKKRKERKEDSDGGDSTRKLQKCTVSNGLTASLECPASDPGQSRDWEHTGADHKGAGFMHISTPTGTNDTKKKGIAFSQCCSPSSQPEATFGRGPSGHQVSSAMRELPDHKGSSNGFVREEVETELSAWQLRPRRGLPLTGAYRNPRFSVLKARVGIFWEGDIRYYRGTIKSFNELSGKYTICYDDNTREDVALEEEKFEWYGPRGRSNGYSSVVRDTMLDLGVQGLPKGGAPVPATSPASEELRSLEPNSLIGKRVFVYWAANGQYYEGEVLAFCKKRRTHLVWYKDGEVEWLDLGKENVIFGELARGCAFPPVADGLSELRPTPLHSWGHEDEEPPRGRAAVGWRIAVFWKDDATFYEGKVTGYNCATGRHDVLYDDNETENLSLSTEKVIWRTPPKSDKNGRTAHRKKLANNGKSRASSQSDVSGKEHVASGDHLLFTIGSTQLASAGSHKPKFVHDRGKERSRKNGTKASQSSKHYEKKHRLKKNTEGESEVLGPPYPGKQEENSPKTDPMKPSLEMEVECNQDEDCGAATASPGACIDKADKQVSVVMDIEEVDRSIDSEEGLEKLQEEVATNATIADNIVQVQASVESIDVLPVVGEEENPLRCAAADMLDNLNGLALQKQGSHPGSPASIDAKSVDGNTGSLQPRTCEETTFEKKLPAVDVTRLVRLPPEFGSLEVKLRITAGAPPVVGAQQTYPRASAHAGDNDVIMGNKADDFDAIQTLQKRVSSIDQVLRVIDHYEHAHKTLGHVATRCDQMAMAEVFSTESLAQRDNPGKGAIGHSSIANDKIGELLTTRGSVSLPTATVSMKVDACEAASKKPPNKKQNKVPIALLSGFSGDLNVPILQSTGSSQVPHFSAPFLSPQAGLATHGAGLGTTQFGVSSIPQVTYGRQNPIAGYGGVDTRLSSTRHIEVETECAQYNLESARDKGNNVSTERMMEDSLPMPASTCADSLDLTVSGNLGKSSLKNGSHTNGN